MMMTIPTQKQRFLFGWLFVLLVVPQFHHAFTFTTTTNTRIIIPSSTIKTFTSRSFTTTTTSTITTLYAQQQPASSSSSQPQQQRKKKKPRFTQKAHASTPAVNKNNNNNNNESSNTNTNKKYYKKREPWESGKSIEELESIMMKRWGTLDNPSSSSSKKKQSGTTTTKSLRRPVLDPWDYEQQKEENLMNNKKNNIIIDDGWILEEDDEDDKWGYDDDDDIEFVEEYYDQDDEGYEPPTLSTSKSSKSKVDKKGGSGSNSISVNHLISPKPKMSSSSSSEWEDDYDDDDDEEEFGTPTKRGSYFFNPNKASLTSKKSNDAAAATTTTTARRNRQKDEDEEEDEEEEEYKPKKNTNKAKASTPSFDTSNDEDDDDEYDDEDDDDITPKPSSVVKQQQQQQKPFLDEYGQEVLLTVDEAMRQFEMTISDEATLQSLEENSSGVNNNLPPIEVVSASKQSWEDLGITHPIILENLVEDMYCPTPLAVQEKTLPAILTGNDVLVGTYTGSGKTLSFLVPLVQQMLWNIQEQQQQGNNNNNNNDNNNNNLGLMAIIVAPGRELASQIVSVARELIIDTPLNAQLAIGGTTFTRNLEQIRKRKPNILVGTPGRIAELVVGKPGEKKGRLNIGNVQALVLDEVDALLEYKPHRDPTQAIMSVLKRRHGDALQAILCSATATDIMDSVKVKEFLRPGYAIAMADNDDVLVTSGKSTTSTSSSTIPTTKVSRTVLHGVVNIPHQRFALDTVRKILHTEPMPQQILIFVENARKVDIIVEKLGDRGIIAAPLHGGMKSEKMDRAEVSKALRDGYVGVVVATELAARGLDAPLLTHVINLDLPTDASHYAHRAGRCGRGGRPGVVINITTNHKERNVPHRFANALGIDMHTVEPRSGKLMILENNNNKQGEEEEG